MSVEDVPSFEDLCDVAEQQFFELFQQAKAVLEESDPTRQGVLFGECWSAVRTFFRMNCVGIVDWELEDEEGFFERIELPESFSDLWQVAYSVLEWEWFENEEGQRGFTFDFEGLLGCLTEANFLSVMKNYHVDHERLRASVPHYGVKGATLMEFSHLLSLIKDFSVLKRQVSIPEFCVISTLVFEKWRRGESIDEDLILFYEWISGRPVMVRSSAVFSEDGAEHTGAGIYKSELVWVGHSFETFKEAVIKVYESVDSEAAVRYRREAGIEDELMGVVVQEYVPGFDLQETGDDFYNGTLNTVIPGCPDLMDFQLSGFTGVRPLLKRKELRQKMFSSDLESFPDSKIFHFQLDFGMYNRYLTPLVGIGAGQMGFVIEALYGAPVQCEFVSWGQRGFFLLQVRPLPSSYTSLAETIEFPEDEKPLHESAAFGVGDLELDVLPYSPDNHAREGVVFFSQSYFGSRHRDLGSYLPQKGAVVVMSASKEFGGHIETLALERGLICLFEQGFSSFLDEMNRSVGARLLRADGMHDEADRLMRRIDYEGIDFKGHTRVRVMANGLEGRIYPLNFKE